MNDQADMAQDSAAQEEADAPEVERDEAASGEALDETDSQGGVHGEAACAPADFEAGDSGAEHDDSGTSRAATTESASRAALDEAAAVVEAILFSAGSPVSQAKIAAAAELPARAVRQAIDDLNSRYEAAGAAFRVEAIAGGYQMLTLPAYHDVIARLRRTRADSKLSQAAMETLAIVAYRQPIIRADVEAIRGVACGEVIRGLLDKGLVKIAGRADVLGRPMLYGTTRRFLEAFALSGLDDLPRVEELRSGAPDAAKATAPAPATAVAAPATAAAEPPSPASEDTSADAAAPSPEADDAGEPLDDDTPADE
jgi:segregation and condensation protein B